MPNVGFKSSGFAIFYVYLTNILIKMLLLRYWNDLLDLFYPNPCVGCGEALVGNETALCTRCRVALPRTQSHQIWIKPLTDKFVGKVPIKSVYAFLRFERGGRVQRLLHSLKYQNRPDVGKVLGQLYGQELAEGGLSKQFDLILPVPLHTRKLAQRGNNQSDMLAEGIASSMGVAWSGELLKRAKFTETQTKKSRIERFENVTGIFEVVESEQLINRRILLVDDVMTTGSTLESAAQVLLQNGAKEVSIATLAAAY